VDLRWAATPCVADETQLADRLAARYPQYRDRPFERVLVFDIVGLRGWAASHSGG